MMRSSFQPRQLAIDAFVASILASITLAAIAISHPASDFYPPARWNETRVTWRFKNDFPMNNFRDRVIDGSQAWNVLDPEQRFQKLTGDASGWGALDCPGQMQNAVHIGHDDGPGEDWAEEFTCFFADPSTIFTESTQIRFDEDEDWYKGSSGSVPLGQVDAQSVATHEWGHSTGWEGHFGESLCTGSPAAPPVQTMCQGHALGISEKRTLEDHDRHTFDNAYD